jgi:predicted permease
MGISLLTGVAFGLVPALRSSGDDLQQRLRVGGRGVAGNQNTRIRHGLVVAEVALAMMLVIGGGLMMRSFLALTNVDPGFKSDHLLAVNLSLSTARHGDKYREVYAQILDRVRSLPGVRAAGAAKDAPFRGSGEMIGFMLPGMVVPAGEDPPTAAMVNISDGYFNAIGARVLAGREFMPSDRADAPLVFVVNLAFAKRWFPGDNAIGKRVIVGNNSSAEIVGLVADIRQTELAAAPPPTVYLHEQQIGRVRMNLIVRTQGPPMQMVQAVRDAIRSVDRLQPITSIFTMEDALGDALARPRLLTVLLGAFGAVGLLLGALGLYGVLAYLVNQRQREIGVRLALGAQRRDLLGMVIQHGLALTAVGVAIGTLGALALGRFLKSVLFGVAPTDPLTFVVVVLCLLVVAWLASLLPARRAANVDVVVTLREE